jgi:hypothetical protein
MCFNGGVPIVPSGSWFHFVMALFTKENFPTSVLIMFLFSKNDQPYSGSMAPATCSLYLSTPFHHYMLCREHTIVLSFYAAPKIPRLSFPYTGQILQLYFVCGLKHWSYISSVDPSTLPHVREWDVLATCRLNFWYLYCLFLQYALRNVVLSRLFGSCNLPGQPSLNHFEWWFPNICKS